MTVTMDAVEVVPTGGALGADIKGVDLSRPLGDALVTSIRDAWLTHQVIRFREQKLSDARLIAVAQQLFGKPQPVEFQAAEYNRDGLLPEIDVVSNVIIDDKPIGCLGAGEATWHTDMSIFELPASATMLYGIEIPPSGGNTRFANMYEAYATLPQRLKDKIAGRTSIHDIAYTAGGKVRGGFEPVTDKSKGPGAVHPIVRTHGETGRKALFLGRPGNGYIHGLSVPESDALLEELWTHMTNPRFVWEHTWRPGDVIVWDNRSVVHSRGSFDAQARRILHRVSVEGEKPV